MRKCSTIMETSPRVRLRKRKARRMPMPAMNNGGHAAAAMTGMQAGAHAGHDMGGHQMEMKGFLGPYSMTREGSGTSWLPDATPHEGVHAMFGDWMVMGHALINGVYDSQGGPRGGSKF